MHAIIKKMLPQLIFSFQHCDHDQPSFLHFLAAAVADFFSLQIEDEKKIYV